MATSPLNVQPYHSRSNSLPSRQHPLTSQIDENLSRLRASEVAHTSSSSSSSIGHKLIGLQDLHECVDMLLQLPLTQQALAQEQHRKWVEELLDGSLMLLDVCSIAKDALLQTKECTQELQSILRRRRGAEMGLANEVKKYLTSRKAVKKVICKALKNLKQMETKFNTSFNKDGENGSVISILREVQAVTVRVLESLLSFISGPDPESKLCRWSLVSKLMHQKRVGCAEEEQKTNEIANAEATLRSLIKSDNIKHIENLGNTKVTSSFLHKFLFFSYFWVDLKIKLNDRASCITKFADSEISSILQLVSEYLTCRDSSCLLGDIESFLKLMSII